MLAHARDIVRADEYGDELPLRLYSISLKLEFMDSIRIFEHTG